MRCNTNVCAWGVRGTSVRWERFPAGVGCRDSGPVGLTRGHPTGASARQVFVPCQSYARLARRPNVARTCKRAARASSGEQPENTTVRRNETRCRLPQRASPLTRKQTSRRRRRGRISVAFPTCSPDRAADPDYKAQDGSRILAH